MIRSDIQIENGPRRDFTEAFGFIYLDADERTAPDEKEDAVVSYAGEHGEHRDGRTCYAPFDYTAKFAIEARSKNIGNVNYKIDAFNAAVREKSADGKILRKKQITFYNLLNRCKIVGYPELVSTPTKVYHSGTYGALEYAVVELKIRVSDPSLCDFKLEVPKPTSVELSLSAIDNGQGIAVTLSRPLAANERLLLLTRGAAMSAAGIQNRYMHHKSKYRWHIRYAVNYNGRKGYDAPVNGVPVNILDNGKINSTLLDVLRFKPKQNTNIHGVTCKKASSSRYFYGAKTGLKKGITFGAAVYKYAELGMRYNEIERVSNVVYFKSNIEITDVGTNNETMQYNTWFSVNK